ncbi:hypothetical protein CcrC1_gp285 [Caulobacter phage C1]|nr:hypothetical protein CcrC1_gp285 [Caulobacter phage C1]UTU08514.1 hypothetical protein CcrC2_gp286 [Caulobacter phage C2]UTU09029.1 hypothetical protein CcrJ4_gp280 [Caulobacter phage J4]UTU10147.1 hypothetical protein CcrRB23_gp285 [Caulobacter phage RB23]WGN97181.1 hypothetical protein [Bertelyvirus sp.]
MSKIVHWYGIKPWTGPEADYRIADNLPAGTKVLTACMREGRPVLYVEKVVGKGNPAQAMYQNQVDAFFVETGKEFLEVLTPGDPFKYVATIQIERPSGLYFYHVYARVLGL